MQGLHLTADLYDCQADISILIDETKLADLCRKATIESGLTIVAEKWHTFPDYQGQPGGVTGTLLLAESHLAIHTWPERGGVTLDVYVCNFEADNSDKAKQLMQQVQSALKPKQSQNQKLMRGDVNGPVLGADLVLESLNQNSVYGFRFDKQLLQYHTGLQQLELFQSNELGLTLRLDGCLMTSESDEAFYHEPLIHPVALSHHNPRTALIVGGGDGGALEELLKHNTIESVSLVELDAGVIDTSKQYLRSINKDSLLDPRLSIKIQDGDKFVRTSNETFDLIFLDLTDPETPAGPLYTQDFFQACKKILNPGGALVMHLGAPFHEPEQVSGLSDELKSVFAQVHGYGLHIPLYGSFWALAIASDDINPLDISAAELEKRITDRNIADLQVYSPEFHQALFSLPVRYRKLMPKPVLMAA